MKTQKQTMPEGYTGMYKQTIFVTEDVNPALFDLGFSSYMSSKGALRVLSKDNPDGTKDKVYFHPDYSAHVEYDLSKDRSAFAVQVTQSADSNGLILEDILENFPELKELPSKKRGVRDPSTVAHCF